MNVDKNEDPGGWASGSTMASQWGCRAAGVLGSQIR